MWKALGQREWGLSAVLGFGRAVKEVAGNQTGKAMGGALFTLGCMKEDCSSPDACAFR